MALAWAFQRNKIYWKDISEKNRNDFKRFLFGKLDEFVEKFKNEDCNSYNHSQSIVDFCKNTSSKFEKFLDKWKFRIWTGQKLINLYLKYLWCAWEINIPPHCPFDSNIINKLVLTKKYNWTEIEKISDYNDLVDAANKEKWKDSLSEWELSEFNWGN